MRFNNILANSFVLQAADFLSNQRVMPLYSFYKEAQWWTRERLLDYQNARLRELLDVCVREVPFYRDLFNRSGVLVDRIKTVRDLPLLPMVTKMDLKQCYPKGCTRKTKWPVTECFTSGSSGNPFAVLVDNLSLSEARALMMLRANYAGWEIGSPAFQTGMTLNRGIVKRLKDVIFNTHYSSAFDLSDVCLDGYLSLIKRKKFRYLMGYPGSLFALADRAKEQNLDYRLDGIVTWGDNLYDHFRSKIESQFKCRVTDTYGCGEGIQVAAQCPEGNPYYHIFMPHVVVEVVNDDGQPVDRGQSGNILLTKLTPGAMPFIRYKIGDLGRLSAVDSCPCGRGLDILDKIEGRDSDFILTPSGNKLIVHFFTGVFEFFPEIAEFRIVQKHADKIDVFIVPQKTVDFNINILSKIESEILSKGDPELKISFNILDKLELSTTGKRKFIISEVSKD